MFAKSAIAALVLATAAMAQSSFDCNAYKASCTTSADYCDSSFQACEDCQAQEQADIHTIKTYGGQFNATKQIEACYFQAIDNQATLNGPYGCDQIFATCKGFPLENNAYCASQKGNCDNYAQQENACRTAYGANQAECSSEAAGHFYNDILG